MHGSEAVSGRVFGDPFRSACHHLVRDPWRAVSPTLVGSVVDVAVGAGKVAAAVHLQHKLPERQGLYPAPAQARHVKVPVGPMEMAG